MAWLEKIRQQPKNKRIRLLWTIVGIVFVLLIGFWIAIGNYNVKGQKDTSLFKTIGTGFQNISKSFKK